MAKYATWPGRTKEDVEHCLKCKWHGIVEGRYVTCEYTIQDGHGMRGCPSGVNCTKFEPGRGIQTVTRAEQAKICAKAMAEGRARAADMVPYTKQGHQEIKESVGVAAMALTLGISRSQITNCAARGTIRRKYARRIHEITGIDVTGGAVTYE